jgi:hypothetical protein
MAEKNFFGQNPLFKRVFSVAFALFLVLGALAFMGCPTESDDSFVDDHKLNAGLVGTWKGGGEGWTDTYTITDNTANEKQLGTISHPEGFPGYNNANIAFVYNFSETSGCLIIKYTDSSNNGKYNAVYFKDLSSGSVLLGDAYDTSIAYPANNDSSVATLDEAILRFAPENADAYGGGAAQTGTPQLKQPSTP